MPIHIAKENVGQHLKEAFSKCWQSDKTKYEKKKHRKLSSDIHYTVLVRKAKQRFTKTYHNG
jgi:hypothetical protein